MEVIEARITDQGAHDDFLEILVCGYRENITTKDEILAHFVTFYFAGTDTTGRLTGMALYCLAAYPEIQHSLYEEVKSIVPNWDAF